MKKKIIILAVILILLVLIIVVLYLLSTKSGVGLPFHSTNTYELGADSTVKVDINELTTGRELIGLFESEQEAKNVADLYGITFVSFDTGVAVFSTDENPYDVIERGQENGYPPLATNQIYHIEMSFLLFLL